MDNPLGPTLLAVLGKGLAAVEGREQDHYLYAATELTVIRQFEQREE